MNEDFLLLSQSQFGLLPLSLYEKALAQYASAKGQYSWSRGFD
jgi:hypothetical protein